MKCKWDDEIAAAVAAKQLEAWLAKCLALLLLIGFDGRKVHCLTLRLLAVYFDVFSQFSNRKCNFPHSISNVHALERFPGNLILSKWVR